MFWLNWLGITRMQSFGFILKSIILIFLSRTKIQIILIEFDVIDISSQHSMLSCLSKPAKYFHIFFFSWNISFVSIVVNNKFSLAFLENKFLWFQRNHRKISFLYNGVRIKKFCSILNLIFCTSLRQSYAEIKNKHLQEPKINSYFVENR
jgi:hypothetical protein